MKYVVKSNFCNGEKCAPGITHIWQAGEAYTGDKAKELVAEGLVLPVEEPALSEASAEDVEAKEPKRKKGKAD
jgi:hypothetical protein